MSLFPAYSNIASTSTDVPSTSQCEADKAWLSNPSFIQPSSSTNPTEITEDHPIDTLDENIKNIDGSSVSNCSAKSKHSKKKQKKERKRHKGKKSKDRSKNSPKPALIQSEFTGKEDYYVDKRPEKSYFKKETIDKSNYSRYRIHVQRLGTITAQQWFILRRRSKEKSKRYFSVNRKTGKQKRSTDANDAVYNENEEFVMGSKEKRLSEEEFTVKTKSFNRCLGENPDDIAMWLDYVRHQENFYMKITKLQLTERKMDILNKALKENPANDRLYGEYVDIIEQTYPSFEVSKILDGLLQKEPTNYILWNAQIMATQGSMARCRVPEVLELYEKCMKNIYKRNRCDQVTMKLFSSCLFFLRQSGLFEQFFALITLALDLNVCENKFSKIQSNESDQNTLIEYEEVVLRSGLPMNEIWLRVEKLRQNYYFLPCPIDRTCSDPQRIVLNEDIYHYIYPLAHRENAFNLVIVILRLLKIPLVDNCGLKLTIFCSRQSDKMCDFDSIEEMLPIFLYRTIFQTTNQIDDILWSLIRDFSIGPSFISTHIGHELYTKYVSEVLLLCAECFRQPNESVSPRRNVFLWLWLRLERILMAIDRFLNKWTEEKAKKLRTKIKNLLKQDENRNCLIFYVEYAHIEYDLKRFSNSEGIFLAAIDQSNPATDNDCTRTEYWYTCVSYVEMLMRERQSAKAIKVLVALALNQKLTNDDESICSDANCLLALKTLCGRLKEISFIERNVCIMEIEQSFLPDYLLSVAKATIYYMLLWKRGNEDPINQLEILLKSFPEKNARHEFIREQLYELYVNVLLYMSAEPTKVTLISENVIFRTIDRALEEFPTNLYLLKCAATCDGQPWYRLRILLTKHNSPVAIVFLVAAAQYRYRKYANSLLLQNQTNQDISYLSFLSSDISDIEVTYKMRVTNLLKKVTGHDVPMRKNSLLWRLYMRSLLDVSKDFDKSRNVLLTALNECPWNKALYLDGTVYVPQELAHLQDLIIEKQLRIYAMPEELEILRDFGGA